MVPASQGCVLVGQEVLQDHNFTLFDRLIQTNNATQKEQLMNATQECIGGDGDLLKALNYAEQVEKAFEITYNASVQVNESIANITIPDDDYKKMQKAVERVGWISLPVLTQQGGVTHSNGSALSCVDTPAACGAQVGAYPWVYKSTLEDNDYAVDCEGLEGMFGDNFCETTGKTETVTGLTDFIGRINTIAATATTSNNIFCFPSATSATCTTAGHHPITGDLDPGGPRPTGAGEASYDAVRATYFELCTPRGKPPTTCLFQPPGNNVPYTTANKWLMAVMWGAAKMKALGRVPGATDPPYICNYTGGPITPDHVPCSKEEFMPYYAEGDTTDRGYVGNLSTDVTTDLFELINGTKPGATKFSERTVHPQLRSLNDTATVLRYETNCKFFAYNMQIFTSVICADSLPTVAMLGLTYLFFFIFGWFSIVIFWIVHHYLKNYYNPPAPDFAKGQDLYRSDTFMAPDSAMGEERTDNKSRVSIAM
eukprot:GHVU01002690.1.p1 GENE.GHVU01002690.1~~GHVU01002690.1.p1  ORF type:complete len:483 (+),score=52.25 GHVU01002690.1:3-1451(+)